MPAYAEPRSLACMKDATNSDHVCEPKVGLTSLRTAVGVTLKNMACGPHAPCATGRTQSPESWSMALNLPPWDRTPRVTLSEPAPLLADIPRMVASSTRLWPETPPI